MMSAALKNRRTAIYVRVSTTKESQQFSPEHQEAVCREKARQLYLDVLESYIYEDRDTGTTIVNRPAIQRMIGDAQLDRFDIVIFASLSRFSRDTLDSISLKRILVNKLGIRVISMDEGYDSEIDTDELKFQIISAVNQKQSEQISFSSRRGKRQSALKGNFTGSIPPYGYNKQVSHNRKVLVPDEQTQGVVRLIYDLYTRERLGEKEIVKYLNEQCHIPSPKQGLWGISTVQRILQNEAYTGINVFGKYETQVIYNRIDDLTDRSKKLVQRDRALWERAHEPGTHEAIIGRDQFELAQQIRKERGGGRRGGIRHRKNIFAGIIRCAHCQAAFVSAKSGSGAKGYRYLICSRRRRQGGSSCPNNYWLPYQPFKEELLQKLAGLLQQEASVEELFKQHAPQLQEIDQGVVIRQLAGLRRQLEHGRRLLFELRKEKLEGQLDERQYLFEKEQYEKEIEQLEWRLSEEEARELSMPDTAREEQTKHELSKLLALHYDESDSFDELHFILRQLIDFITVDREGHVVVQLPFFLPDCNNP